MTASNLFLSKIKLRLDTQLLFFLKASSLAIIIIFLCLANNSSQLFAQASANTNPSSQPLIISQAPNANMPNAAESLNDAESMMLENGEMANDVNEENYTPFRNIFYNSLWGAIVGATIGGSLHLIQDNLPDSERFQTKGITNEMSNGAIYGAVLGLLVGSALAISDVSFPYPDLLESYWLTSGTKLSSTDNYFFTTPLFSYHKEF